MRWERKRARQAAPLLLFLLTGCGSDRPVMGPPDQPRQMQADNPPADPSDSTPTDPASSGAADPLVGDAGQPQTDPLLRHDPLLGHDPMEGRGMPTQHSHWLRGHLRHAQVTVLLNGVWHGSFSGTLDQDITMSLRQGTNTVTFKYQPSAAGSEGDLEIVEGEHQPPAPPLVTFHSQSGSDVGADASNGESLRPVTQTSPFVAN